MNNSLTILRSILFPREDICHKTELYYRVTEGSVRLCEADKQLKIQGTAAFDTYFNALPLSRYREYCKPTELFLRLKVCGDFVLRIFGVRILNNTDTNNSDSKSEDVFVRYDSAAQRLTEKRFVERMILKKRIQYSTTLEDITDLTSFIDTNCDHLYFTLTSDNGIFYGGELLCGTEQQNGVNIAAVICTYRREKFLLHNHHEITRYLSGSTVFHQNNIHFYIVDNGKTLDRSMIENEFVTLVPNENTGGSGGFIRGYHEALHSGRGHTHILFMDDDIVLDCEMLLRVHSLLQLRKPEYRNLAVGGTMLRLDDYVTQHEAGSFWDGKRLHSIGNGRDMTLRKEVFAAAYYPDGNYNAWWFYCFPADWQEKYGYPLQFFVKEDDIEYSLRCADNIAVLSGIAVWHDDFDSKYDGFQEYYIKRNELILTSVNDQKPYTFFQIRKLILSVMKQTVYQRYFLADLIFRAYDDYLKGWKHFYRTDTVRLNEKLMAACPPLMDDDELLEQYGVAFDKKKYEYSLTEPENLKKQALTLNGYLIPQAFYHKDKGGFSLCDLAQCRIVNFYKHKRVLHYDTSRHKGFVTKQKKGRLFWNVLRLIVKPIKFLCLYPIVRHGYRKHLKELSMKVES